MCLMYALIGYITTIGHIDHMAL